MKREERIASGFAGVVGLLVAAFFVPELVAAVLFTFSVVALVWALVGLVRPDWGRIPNRLASVWIFALSFGLFLGGGVLLSPPEEEVTASDAPSAVPAQDSPSASVEAATHLRDAADCLDFTRGSLVGVFDPADRRPPQLVVDGILRACGLAFNEYTGLSPEAETLVLEAIERIRWTFQGLAAARTPERVDRSLDNVIVNLEGQAVRLEEPAAR